MKRNATAVWQGTIKDGQGALSTTSGVLADTPYSFKTRFENENGTNPEELIAAAHAGCFSMALSVELEKSGFMPQSIHTRATLTLDRVDSQWSITDVLLEVTAEVDRIDEAGFREIAEGAKAGCPVSRLLRANIKLDAKLDQSRTIERSSA